MQEVNEFLSFENYIRTLFQLQSEIINEIQKYQLTISQQATNYERLSENFTTLRRMKGREPKDGSQSPKMQFLSSQ